MSAEYIGRGTCEEAAATIRRRSHIVPRIGLILGSGLSDLANEVAATEVIPYHEIPHFPQSTVTGHEGRLLLGVLEHQPVIVMQGRAHFYEGYSMQQVAFPVRVMKLLGTEVLLVTNAAGGINPNYNVGDLMCISDHIFFPGMAGLNPLRGPNDDAFGPRFPDMSAAYDITLRERAMTIARREGIPTHEGIYAMLAGPSYETPAELRFLRTIGVDAVGMSTAPEVIVARHCGLRVLGISGITNTVHFQPQAGVTTTHEEVLAAASIITPRMAQLIRGVLRELP